MLIAIDYDGTFTRHPDLWVGFIEGASRLGHEVVICTARAFPPDTARHMSTPFYCTAGQAKRDYLASLGLHPDVWIDDDPQSILTDDPSTV